MHTVVKHGKGIENSDVTPESVGFKFFLKFSAKEGLMSGKCYSVPIRLKIVNYFRSGTHLYLKNTN